MHGVAKKNPYFLCKWNGLVGAGEISLISSEHNLLWGIYLCSKNYTCTPIIGRPCKPLSLLKITKLKSHCLQMQSFGKIIWPSHADVGAKFSPGRNQKPEFQPIFITVLDQERRGQSNVKIDGAIKVSKYFLNTNKDVAYSGNANRKTFIDNLIESLWVCMI